ncbi:MAG TPA: DUF2275 domain-containing protein, partial [Nitrospirae bacterium]|nr:DUF2275 domain-containing protein [Nitrospirota bacterium]
MKCSDIEKKLSAYIEEMLSGEDRKQVDAHLETCLQCRASLDDLERSIAYTQGIEEVEPPVWLKQKVMARVRQEGRAKKAIFQKLFFPLHIKVPIEVIATLAVAVTAFYVFKSVEPDMKMAYAPAEQDITSRQEEIKGLKKDEYFAGTAPGYGMSGTAEKQRVRIKTDDMDEADQRQEPEALDEERPVPKAAYRVPPQMKAKEELESAVAGSKLLADTEQPAVSLTVYVEDIETAGKEIEAAITRLNGKMIRTESFEDKDVLIAELNAEKADELNERLGQIGEVKGKEALLALEDKEPLSPGVVG